MQNLFKNLKVGDKIAIMPASHYAGEVHWRIVEVTRLTKTWIVIGDRRFYKKNSEEVSSEQSWRRASLVSVEEAQHHNLKAKVIQERRRLASSVSKLNFGKLNTEQLKAILEIATQEK